MSPYQLKLNNNNIYPITGVEAVVDINGNNIPLILHELDESLLSYADTVATTKASGALDRANDYTSDKVSEEYRRAITAEGGLSGRIEDLENLIGENPDGAIDKFNEIVEFLNGISDTESLDRILSDISTRFSNDEDQITALVDGINLSITVEPTVIYKGSATSVTITGSLADINGSKQASSFILRDEREIIAQNLEGEAVSVLSTNNSVTENKDTVTFTAEAEYKGMLLNKSTKLQLRNPIYYGFGLGYNDIVTNVNRYNPTTSAKHIYSKTNGINNANFFIMIPSDITDRPSGFKMGGAPFEMSMEQQTINNVTYYVYTSGAKYNTGASLQVEAY